MTGRRLSHITVKCAKCVNEHQIEAAELEEFIDSDLTVNMVSELYSRLKCKLCASEHAIVFDDTSRLLIDPLNLTPCDSCGNPIILPRLIAVGDTSTCTTCSERGPILPEEPPPPKRPLRPANKLICPRCESPTVIRKNTQSGNLFLGCTKFPECRWTASLEN